MRSSDAAPPLRLWFDARMAAHGGIGTYIRHLVPALGRTPGIGGLCVAGAPDGTFADEGATRCRHPYPAPIYSVQEQLRLPRARHGARLWHSPHFNIPLRWRGPLVATIHDLIHLKSRRYARTPLAAPYAAFMLRQVARRARAIIAVSEATKRDYCDWAKVALDRVTVIPHGVPADVTTPPSAPDEAARRIRNYGITPPFLLWVSTIRPHKNPLMALRAFAHAKQRYRLPHQLVMVGARPPWYRAPLEEARRLQLGDAIRWVGTVLPEELAALYAAATALVMPSYEEGFCFPVLEAMAAGCPVVASTTPAIIELVGNAGVTIDPDDVDRWVDALYNMMIHDDRRRTFQDRGRLRAREFTWPRAAAQHLHVYRSALAAR